MMVSREKGWDRTLAAPAAKKSTALIRLFLIDFSKASPVYYLVTVKYVGMEEGATKVSNTDPESAEKTEKTSPCSPFSTIKIFLGIED
jgi:hypothetical protein